MSKFFFGERSAKKKSELHPFLIAVLDEAITYTSGDFSITCGHRGELAQNRAYDKGFSRIRFPNGKHNKTPSEALDCAPYLPQAKSASEIWKPIYYGALYGVFQVCEKIVKAKYPEFSNCHLRWGADWNMNGIIATDQKLDDYGHFEVVFK